MSKLKSNVIVGIVGMSLGVAAALLTTGSYRQKVDDNCKKNDKQDQTLSDLEMRQDETDARITGMEVRQDADHEMIMRIDKNVLEILKRTEW